MAGRGKIVCFLLKNETNWILLDQVLESETVAIKFHAVYEKLNRALSGMPYHELGITDEVKEQVGLSAL